VYGSEALKLANATLANCPVDSPDDADFGGYDAGSGNSSEVWLRNTSTDSLAQPMTIVMVGKNLTSSQSASYEVDSNINNATLRISIRQSSGHAYHRVWAGSAYPYMDIIQSSYAFARIVYVNGASTSYHTLLSDGTEYGPTVIATPGANPIRGCTLFHHPSTSTEASYHKLALVAMVDGALTAGQETDFFEKLETEMGFTLP